VNSGDTGYNLIDKYKSSLTEYLMIEYLKTKNNNTTEQFLEYWNNGEGIFTINSKNEIIVSL